MQSFKDYAISPELLETLEKMGFTAPTEIQQKTLPVLLEGKSQDLVALASTGTGKTAAFGIPLVEKLDAKEHFPQALVLSPTRELAMQVAEQLKKFGAAKKLQVAVIYGGSSYRTQIAQLKKGAQIVVATPGRLVDLLEQDLLSLTKVKMMILDEADEMLSMGFQESLNFILSATHPEDMDDQSVRASCQTWLFSATMSPSVRQLTKRYLEKPFFIEVSTGRGLSPTIRHTYFTVRFELKTEGILRLLRSIPQFYGFIFCQTKLEVAELEQAILKNNIPVESLHGDKNQKDREFILKRFRAGETRVVVATDVAARGLDIQNLTHVINYSLPWNIETYIHRVGRTGRNGNDGHAFTLVSPNEIRSLVHLQKQTGIELNKGAFPKPIDHAVSEIRKIFSQMSQDFHGMNFRMASQALKQVTTESPELVDVEQEDFLAKLLLIVRGDLFQQSERNLDFLEGKTPREFEDGPRKSFSRGGRGGEAPRFGGGRRRERDDRSDRGERSERRDRGDRSERGERSERGPRREARFEKSDRPFRREDRDESRSSGGPKRSFGERRERSSGGGRDGGGERSGGSERSGGARSGGRRTERKRF